MERVTVANKHPSVSGDDPVVRTVGPEITRFGIVDPVEEDRFWQRYFRSEPYFDPHLSYDDYGPAYRIGIAHRLSHDGYGAWNESEEEVRLLWQRRKGYSRLTWAQALEPIRSAWSRVDKALSWHH